MKRRARHVPVADQDRRRTLVFLTERHPATAAADAAPADGNLLEEDADERDPHPTGIAYGHAAH